MRIILLNFLGLLISLSSIAQRHTTCDNGFELLVGAPQYGYVISPGFVRYFSDKLYAKANLLYSRELDRNLYHYVMGANVTGAYTFFQLPHDWYFNAIGGVGFTSEKGKWKEADSYSFPQNKIGLFVGGEVEKYITNEWSVIANYNQQVVSNTKGSWGFHRWYLTVGARWHFYRLHRCNPSATHYRKRK